MESLLYVALGAGITVYLIFVLIFGNKYMDKLVIERRVEEIQKFRTPKKSVEEEELSKPVGDRIFKPLGRKIIDFMLKIIPKENNENLKRQLSQGGINMTVDEFNAARVIVIAVTGILFFLFKILSSGDIRSSILWAMTGVIAGYLIMILGLKRKISKRKEAINMQLPEVMDLLSVSVEAGLGFDQALKEVVETFKGPLIDELNTTKREMQLGRTKREALLEMSERCQVEELSLFVSAVIQGEQFGISLKNILRTQSYSIRLRHKQRIEEKAAKLPVKIILPVAIFIFPVLFIVVLGPTIFNLMKSLAGF